MKASSSCAFLALSSVLMGASALPKPFSQVVGDRPRILLSDESSSSSSSSNHGLNLSGLPPIIMARSTTLRKKKDDNDSSSNSNNILRNTAQDVVSFAKQHPDLFLYAAVAAASAYIVKSTFFDKRGPVNAGEAGPNNAELVNQVIHNNNNKESSSSASGLSSLNRATTVESSPSFSTMTTAGERILERYSEAMSPAVAKTTQKKALVRGGAASRALLERLKIGFYFGLWYALNVIYNIINKKVLNVWPAPLTVGTIQFGIGALYVLAVWLIGLRPTPTLSEQGKNAVANVGLWHALGQLASMISLGAGPVSFTHIVKALEPFFSAVVSGIFFGKWMKPQVYATLIPVVGGVGYACLKERSFSWLAFGAAMASNVAFALRAVLSKGALQSGESAGTNLTPPNMFGLVTIAAFFMSIPMALLKEGTGMLDLFNAALEQSSDSMQFIRAVILSGLFHYLNNEVMYLALGSVHPVTLAVGNTMKRVFIMVASVMVFRNPISVQAGIGSAIGIGGVLLYSLTKQYYESLEAAAAAEASTKGKRRIGGGRKATTATIAISKVKVSSSGVATATKR